MARSRISYNVHAQVIKDHTRFINHLKAINPTVVLIMDAVGLAREIKAMLPETLVISREYGGEGDDTVHLRMSPGDWLKWRAPHTEGGIYAYTTNEPGFDDNCLSWHIELMELAARRNVPLVIGNWAVGIPTPEEWPRARRILELLDQHRNLFVLGLHEYAGAVITSGLYGGYPDRAGVAPGDNSKPGLNLIPPQNWPPDVSNVTMFHLGRFNFMIRYCQSIGIRPPRIIMTEHGMDDLSDIKPWTQRLKVRQPYYNVRGWKSLTDQWNDWYSGLGWSPERSYFEQLRWADRVIYQNSVVEGQCIFSWGHSSQMWEQFDIAEAFEFQRLLEGYAQEPTAPAATFAPTITEPVDQPAGSIPVIITTPVSTGFAPIGERPPEEVSGAGSGFVAPVVAVGTGHSEPPEKPAVVAKTISVSFTENEINALMNGLRALNQFPIAPELSSALNKLQAALESGGGVG